MDKRSNIMQALGRSSRMLGSVGGPTAPSFYKGWGGPLTGAAVKGLAFGLPAYGLTRLALKATGKDKEMDSHRAGLLSGILSGVGAAGMDLMNVGDNFRLAPGGIMGGLKSLNKDPGVVEGQLMGKQSDFNGPLTGIPPIADRIRAMYRGETTDVPYIRAYAGLIPAYSRSYVPTNKDQRDYVRDPSANPAYTSDTVRSALKDDANVDTSKGIYSGTPITSDKEAIRRLLDMARNITRRNNEPNVYRAQVDKRLLNLPDGYVSKPLLRHELAHLADPVIHTKLRGTAYEQEIPATTAENNSTLANNPGAMLDYSLMNYPRTKQLSDIYEQQAKYGPQYYDNARANANRLQQEFGYNRASKGFKSPQLHGTPVQQDWQASKEFMTRLRGNTPTHAGYNQWLNQYNYKAPKATIQISNNTKQSDYNGSMRGTQGGAIQSGEGGNFSGPGCKVRQEDPPSMRQNRSNKAKGDTTTFASSDSGGQITDHPELVNGPVVKEALARVSKYLVTAQKSKQADYSDPDYNTSGAFMNYSTYVPPGYQMTIPAHYTAAQIDNDPYMSPQAKAQALMHIDNASDGRPGLITVNDITRAAVGAGIGYASASLFGRVLGGLFGGLSPQTQRTMQQTGAVAGLLMNTGAIGGR